MIKLSKIAKVTAGQAAPKEFSDIGFPFIRAGHIEELISGNKLESLPKVSDEVAKKKRLKLIPKGTILFAKSGMSATKNRVYITDKQSYFVSHLAGILPSEKFSSSYLARYLSWYNPAKLILDSAYPSIRLADINNLKIPLPPLEQQKKIAAILDAADTYRQKTKALITKYDELTQSLFLDMFGDPVRNPMKWTMKPLKEFGKIITGNTPSRKNDANFNDKFIEWIKTNNITSAYTNVTTAKEYLSEEGLLNSRSVNKGSLLVACIAGSINSIGRAALTDRKVAFNQQINAIEPFKNISSIFLYYLFKSSSSYIQSHASNGMKRMLSKGDFQKIKMICPNIDIQNQFAERVKAIETQKAQAQASLVQAENLFNSLLQRAFKGELV
jgi:type I restriction enzyme S subunit